MQLFKEITQLTLFSSQFSAAVSTEFGSDLDFGKENSSSLNIGQPYCSGAT